MQIIVAGSSFAGLMTIKTLRKHGCNAPIKLIAPQLAMFYYPASIWIPSGIYKPRDLSFPLNKFIQRYQVEYLSGSITKLNAKQHRLSTTAGDFDYEQLVIATGGHSLKQLPGIEHTFIPCAGHASITAMMQRLAALNTGTLAFGFAGNLAQLAAMRSEVLFEFLFGIDTLLRRQKRRHHFKLVFFTPCTAIDARWGQYAGSIKTELERRAINSYIGYPLQSFTANQVIFAHSELNSDLTVFLPEMVGPLWAQQSDLPLSDNGFIRADNCCRVLGHEGNVYVAGDAGCFPVPEWVAKQAHTADLQAIALAKNLIGDRNGEHTEHSFRQEFICIVDMLDSAILIFRNATRGMVFKSKALHLAKRLFVWSYLYKYR